MYNQITVDEFENELNMFEEDFRCELEDRVIANKFVENITWKEVRDELFKEYKVLDRCYSAHGTYRRFPPEEQPETARWGAKLAYVMYSSQTEILDKHYNIHGNGSKPKIVDKPDSRVRFTPEKRVDPNVRWKAKGAVIPITDEPNNIHISVQILADAIKDVDEGFMMTLFYPTKEDALYDQSNMRRATDSLGWNDKPGRWFATRITETTSGWAMEVRHLSSGVNDRRKR